MSESTIESPNEKLPKEDGEDQILLDNPLGDPRWVPPVRVRIIGANQITGYGWNR